MTVTEFFAENRNIKQRLQALRDRLTELKSITEYKGVELSETSDIQPKNLHSDKMLNYLEKSEMITEQIARLQDVYINMVAFISMLPEPEQQTVLTMYYIDGESIESISDKLDLSYKTVSRRKSEALMYLECAIRP